MSEDSDELDGQIKPRQHKRARKDDGRNKERKFESGSEEEYVIGNTAVQKNDW